MGTFINYPCFFENTNIYDIIHIKKLFAKQCEFLTSYCIGRVWSVVSRPENKKWMYYLHLARLIH